MDIGHTETIVNPHTRKFILLNDGKPLSWSEVVSLWANDEVFRTYFLRLLADSSFSAFFWETLPVTADTFDQDFEFVLVDSPALAKVTPERQAFGDYFGRPSAYPGVAAFPNLGGDAFLVVPAPEIAEIAAYSHIANFVRNAPFAQQQALLQCLSAEINRKLSNHKLWVSTSGLGVYWLHIRLDSRPKYYQYSPYKT